MSDMYIVLVTGASRGLGKALVEAYLARPNTTVIAATRTSSQFSQLANLPAGTGSTVIPIQLASESESDAKAAYTLLTTQHNISYIDLIIANAAISTPANLSYTDSMPISAFREHFEANTLGPIILYQTFVPLLRATSSLSRTPKFVTISSDSGSLGGMKQGYVCAYGLSKAGLNYFGRKLHFEGEDWGLISLMVHPGWMTTDMGNYYAGVMGLPGGVAPVQLSDSVAGVVKVVDGATRKEAGFWDWEGKRMEW